MACVQCPRHHDEFHATNCCDSTQATMRREWALECMYVDTRAVHVCTGMMDCMCARVPCMHTRTRTHTHTHRTHTHTHIARTHTHTHTHTHTNTPPFQTHSGSITSKRGLFFKKKKREHKTMAKKVCMYSNSPNIYKTLPQVNAYMYVNKRKIDCCENEDKVSKRTHIHTHTHNSPLV